MSKQIWLAPILSNNRERLLERASEVLASGPSEALLYLAASRPLLELAAVRLLDGVRTRGVWGSLPVHLFRGFARYVLATALDEETQSPLTSLIAIDQKDLPLKRSLIAQIINRLADEEKLRAIASLSRREGCINTVTALIGEIQRAGKTPAEFSAIVAALESDAHSASESTEEIERRSVPLQIDFDKDIALIYEAYSSALEECGFTEDDADQLRALEVLRGEASGKKVILPWLSSVRLLIVDGFFDFTPVQGDILRLLIPQIPEVIVNLSRDERNTEIFRPFGRTIEQISSMAKFEVFQSSDVKLVAPGLSSLRKHLFNPIDEHVQPSRDSHSDDKRDQEALYRENIRVFDCGDRETELRAIAKEIKRLVMLDHYRLSEIAVVLRQYAPYEDEITRVFREEQISCNLNQRIDLTEVPAVRAAIKLFELLIALGGDPEALKATQIADLAKSGYFGLSENELAGLRARFELQDLKLVDIPGYRREPAELKVGFWDADELENAVAFVGDDLRIPMWIIRARKFTAHPAEPKPSDEKLNDPEPEAESESEDDLSLSSDQSFAVRQATAGRVIEPVDVPLPGSERRAKPARELHPALIAWSVLLIDRFASILNVVPREGSPREMRDSVIRLLDRLQFAREVRSSDRGATAVDDLAALTLDLRGLEGLRRALFAATRSIEIASPPSEGQQRLVIRLAKFLDETLRCIKSQTLVLSSGDPDGLRVLEATDIRGLQFRAVFIAGLYEGSFPLRPLRDWFYPHEERERLKEYGLTLEDISPETLLKEEHYFYQAACRATERLYLSRPLVKEDGSETVASYYIEEIARAIAPSQFIRDTVRRDYDGRSLFEASNPRELAMLVVRQEERRNHYSQRDGNFSSDVITRLIGRVSKLGYVSESAKRRIAIERERGGLFFGCFDGQMSSRGVIEKLQNQYGILHTFSASELSLYGRCPFKFFAEKVLKLEPRGEAAIDMTALDAGSLLHDALRRFFELHRNHRLTDLDPDELKRQLDDAADAVFDQHERAVPPLNPKVWAIDREIKKVLLQQVLAYELTLEQQTREKNVTPSFFELAFGMQNPAIDPNSVQQPLEINREHANHKETIRIRGQIDRVDQAKNGTVIAYDYKLSRGATLEDMAEGRALQLHIYLAALEQLFFPDSNIAGAGYYTIRGMNERRNRGLYRKAMNEYTAVSTRSILSDEEWTRVRAEMQDRIWEFIDRMRTGRFLVAPSAPDDSCPRCDYSAVCRYEKFRIRRKVEVRPATGDR